MGIFTGEFGGMIVDLQYQRENGPICVLDANGCEVLDAVEVDTESGRVVRFRRDLAGQVIINWKTGQAEFEEVLAAAPLVITPKKDCEP